MSPFKSLFAFDKKQQRGIFVLMLLLVVVFSTYSYLKHLPKKALVIDSDFSNTKEKLAELLN